MLILHSICKDTIFIRIIGQDKLIIFLKIRNNDVITPPYAIQRGDKYIIRTSAS